MLLIDTIKMASMGIAVQKGRALLTMLGIIIGVASVVLMTGIGASMEGVILGQISTIGPRSMVIFPGTEPGPASAASTGFDSLTFQDVEALKQLGTIKSLAPIMFIDGKTTYGREEILHTVVGTVDNFFRNQSIGVAKGRLIDANDETKAKSIAVLGPDSARDLFGDINPVGKDVTIAGRKFTVVGVLESVGSQVFQNLDERVYIPLSVAKSISGKRYLSYMTMQAVYGFDAAFRDVKAVLRQRHQIINPEDDPDEDDFTMRSSEQANEILGNVSLGLTIFISLIAGISLIVGGIGIMNIMLVAVTERTREIGLRKAVGAHKKDILLQFLLESIVLTLIGACIGLALGIGFAALVSLIVKRYLARYVFAISIPAILLAFGMAAVTGLVFGIYPARKASKLSPIDALRYE